MGTRPDLINVIFGQSTLPTDTPTVTADVATPLAALSNHAQTNAFDCVIEGETHRAWHHIPTAANNQLVIVHHGHTDTHGAIGIQETVAQFIAIGCDVVLMMMPGRGTSTASSSHDSYAGTYTNPLAQFLSPVVQVLNELAASFAHVFMTGISGGGWTTSVAAAIDTRIDTAFEVAGSLPVNRRESGSIGDYEQVQIESAWDDYDEVYRLAATPNRQFTQLLNRNDDCCFGFSGTAGAYGSDYASAVVDVVNESAQSQGGIAMWCEDATHSIHQISTEGRLKMLLSWKAFSRWDN